MKFPYGISDFHKLISKNYCYIDRTAWIPILEQEGDQLLFLRPRRFGKSLLISMLVNYYDINKADDFEALFGHLDIGKQPTAEHNQYLVMVWDFSLVAAQTNAEETRQALFNYLNSRMNAFIERYQHHLKQTITLNPNDAIASFDTLCSAIKQSGQQLYLLIDEYDNFANELSMQLGSNKQHYQSLLYGEGIVKTLFKAVKSAASGNGLARVFITGVAPVVMSDISSGYNVATNIYFSERFNTLCGISHKELQPLVEQLVNDCQLPEDQTNKTLKTLQRFYNGYRFCHDEQAEFVYNPTLVFYFLRHFQAYCRPPQQILDNNLAMDKGKLNYIANLPQGERVIRQALDQTNDLTLYNLKHDFGVEEMHKANKDQTFMLSLLYYFGILTIATISPFGEMVMRVPNLAIRRLYLEALRERTLPDSDSDHAKQLARQLYQHADIEPLANYMEQTFFAAFDNRDYRWSNELTLKTAFLTLLYNDTLYLIDSEKVLERRYADLVMIVRSTMRQYALKDLLMEFKFISLKKLGLSATEVKQQSRKQLLQQPIVRQALDEAKQQLTHYRQVLVKKYAEPERLHCFAIVGLGFERLVWESMDKT